MHCYKILLDRTNNIEEHPCHSILPIEFGTEGISLQILTCSMLNESTGYSIIKITDETGEKIREGNYKAEYGECNINKLFSKCYFALVINKRCLLSKLINESGCFLTSAIPKTDTLIEWTLIGPNSEALHTLAKKMRDSGYKFELISSENLVAKMTLTPKQEEYFNIAMNLGYYDVPKKIGLDEMSKILNCSKSTLNVILRTAEKKIFDYYRVSAGRDHI